MNTRNDKQDRSDSRVGYEARNAAKSAAASPSQGRDRETAKGIIPEQKGCGPSVTEYPFLDLEEG